MKTSRVRLDQLLHERGLAESRSRAQALILAGLVFSGERRLDKPGLQVARDIELELRERPRFVSRGGEKLAAALDLFAVDPAGLVCLDVGASTGGFTDVLLQAGAARVHAVDVGHGQLDWRLRGDPRVVVLERTNARHLTREQIAEPVDLVVCDASFISLTKVLPAALALTAAHASCIALIKPQFEAGRAEVGKGGVVRDAAVHARVRGEIGAWFDGLGGWRVAGIEPSPLLGPKGNREFLICAHKIERR